MNVLFNEPLEKYTTIKIGGVAKEMITPTNIEELKNIMVERKPKYFLGGGSNLLISDREYDLVINLRQFNQQLEMQQDGTFIVGASVRLQKLINYINDNGYGGIEYLFSVPGLVGGAIVMNAGRGKKYSQSISDYITEVDVLRCGKVITLSKNECEFSYRNSIFKNSNDIVLSARFQFPIMSRTESYRRKKQRIMLCKEKQDMSCPNAGTVFSESNIRIMKHVKKVKLGNNVHFSGKTENWLLNEGGSFDDAVLAIRRVKLLHKLFFKKCILELIIWE